MTSLLAVLATDVLTLLTSGAVVVWAALFVQKEHGGWVLILLSIAMFLVGGGIGPLSLASSPVWRGWASMCGTPGGASICR